MKMKLVDRILLGFYALLGAIASVLLALEGFHIYSTGIDPIVLMGIQIPGGIGTVVVCFVIAVVLLIWSVKMFMLAFKHEPKVDKTSVSVQNTEDGSVRITVSALDTLIKQAIGNRDGIMEIKSKIINHEDSISVHIDMTLTSDVHIPNVTMLLQRAVKNFIEEFSGIAVREVTVLVSSIIEIVPAPLAIESKEEPVEATIVEEEEQPMPEPETETAPVEEAFAEQEAPVSPVEEVKEPDAEAEDNPSPVGAAPEARDGEDDPEKEIW